jgi:hypothetical protein
LKSATHGGLRKKEKQMKGLLGSIIRKGLEDSEEGDHLLRPGREFDVVRSAEKSAQSFLQTYGNLLSCFTLQGEFGLWKTLETYMRTKGLVPEVLEAIEDGDEAAYMKAIFRSQQRAFHDLYTKGAIYRLMIVDALPRAAIDEWLQMEKSVVGATAPNAAPAPAQAPVVPVVAETPIEACVREFKEMPSQAWKTKWLNNRNNRPIADQAFEEGRI